MLFRDLQIVDFASSNIDFIHFTNYNTSSSLDFFLVKFEVYLQKTSGIEKRQRLISRQIHIVIILELSQRESLMLVILLFTYKELKTLIKLLFNPFSSTLTLSKQQSSFVERAVNYSLQLNIMCMKKLYNFYTQYRKSLATFFILTIVEIRLK